ncbi:MAG: PolC-type DNA polymerase III [Lachnospiraceae bacterium]|nr:PolC-type DNA polymerase III [Lachnospiraceae bacterium]
MDINLDKEKTFFEAFRTLRLSGELTAVFSDTVVERLVYRKKNDRLCVYLRSGHLIEKAQIREAEEALKRQVLSGRVTKVRIYEHFLLPKVYDTETILQEYKKSLYEEIREYDRFLYTALSRSPVTVTADNHLLFAVDPSIMQKEFEEEIRDIFEKVFLDRFNLEINVDFAYEELPRLKGYVSPEIRLASELKLMGFSETKPLPGQNAENVPDEEALRQDPDASAEAAASESAEPPAPLPEKENPPEAPKAQGSGWKNGERKRSRSFKQSDNPDVIYGREISGEIFAIADTDGLTGPVNVKGRIIRLEKRETKTGRLLVIFDITDQTDTVTVKFFPREEQQERLFASLKEGATVIVNGDSDIDRFDGEYGIGRVTGIMKAASEENTPKRSDEAPVKRVELHCHTKMSDMDGISDVAALMKRAASYGHKALAITDHGVVQAFTDAFHALKKVQKIQPDFKLIYGIEGYLVDDLSEICENPGDHGIDDTFVVFDIETTGLSPVNDEIIEIGAVRVEKGEITGRFSEFVNPKRPIPYHIEQLTSINDEMVADADFITSVLPRFLAFCEGAVLVAHNASFDISFIREKSRRLGIEQALSFVDTVGLSRFLLPKLSKFTLDKVAKALGVSLENHHRAVEDAEATAEIFVKLLRMLRQRNILTLAAVNERSRQSDDLIKKANSYHVIILAKNEIGRINLYRLVSLSHVRYFQKVQRIPKSLIEKYREGLIIGSACEAGELFRAVLEEKEEQELSRIVNFYDYLEIQPVGNNAFLIEDEKHENITCTEDLQRLNKKIAALGEKYGKPVVATCDVHFLDPEDEVYRRIIMTGKGFKDADSQAPLYLRTTEEMLSEFSYFGAEKAYEYVVENTNLIADMVDVIEPVRPDKCPPVIPHSDEILKDICYDKAHEIYGENLPEAVEKRLERELHSIITNGFAVMYIIAQKLVWKSVEDGYLVGSRGSVGSSLVATMAGITEVNPLPPHYLCPHCHYVDFDSEEVRSYAGRAGCDMPDRLCPVCGEPLSKEGFDIPFETFLGFKGDKEPDIDLNFSGEYQSKAHKYTEVIFGDGQTYRAGTIGTLAEKTAYGYVRKYYEEKGMKKRSCEINRITQGCTGIHRTTGQHPGGIIVLPLGEEIDTFTPIQRPANKMDIDIITTHFDYHSIDHNLLKLDILGHDDPTMIRMLQDLTDTDPTEVALDDKEVMSLFQNTEALHITPEDIGDCPLGTLGIPEFGTDFAMQMLIDAAPTAFSDLVRIAGLAHGTDVWLGNAETLIKEGIATIATAICTRDDIMTYLIQMGLEPATAFSIMENVRKGKVAKGDCDKWPAWKEDMAAHNVPDWYIGSCEKIKYMFPKAHAAAYVMMAWRIAYYKVNYPLAYYCAYFSIRADALNYEKMCLGAEKVAFYLRDYKKRSDELTKKEQDEYRDMRLVQEMYARGYSFTPIDLFTAQAHKCSIVNGKIMPRLDAIDGLGGASSDAVYNACRDGEFLSKEDFQQRTGVNQTVLETLIRLNVLSGLPDSNQLSLFDMLA